MKVTIPYDILNGGGGDYIRSRNYSYMNETDNGEKSRIKLNKFAVNKQI